MLCARLIMCVTERIGRVMSCVMYARRMSLPGCAADVAAASWLHQIKSGESSETDKHWQQTKQQDKQKVLDRYISLRRLSARIKSDALMKNAFAIRPNRMMIFALCLPCYPPPLSSILDPRASWPLRLVGIDSLKQKTGHGTACVLVAFPIAGNRGNWLHPHPC